MIQTAGRLTLYGLIALIDLDLRSLVKEELQGSRDVTDILPEELFSKLKARAEKDGVQDHNQVLDYLDFGDSLALLRRNSSYLSSSVAKFIKRHGAHFDRLLPVRNRVMHSRPILLSDYSIADDAAKMVREMPARLFPATREFDAKIRSDPHHAYSIDMNLITRDEDRIPNNLPLPDFDETGFIGREDEKQELRRLADSQWPVVTIVGEGGYGKTALALQVAYDLLDDPAFKFDAIVWTTAKRIRLTFNDIEVIEGAVTSSLGLIREASRELGGESQREPVEELVEYLNNFKVLLIIDNLETVLDPVLHDFLRRLNGKSKVITTSRVGLGELSYNYPLRDMDLKDAARLLRSTAKARRVDDLGKLSQNVIETYCKKMKLNAGFIKWFVTCVQYGKRPEEILANPKIFLDFCVSYVYEHVSEDAKLVTKAMLAAPGKQSLSLISYLTGLSGDSLELALASLQAANILKMSTVFQDDRVDTTYELSDLPRLYILKNFPPSPKEDAEFKKKKKEVVSLFDRLQVERGTHRYDPRSIACRTPSDSVSAKLLIDALDRTRRGQFKEALELVSSAASLDPSFAEVYRVEAYVQFWAGNHIAAEDSYETAVSYDPKSAPLRYWFGGFLLRGYHDPGRAKTQFLVARELDPCNPRIAIEIARCQMHLGEFREASDEIAEVLQSAELPLKERRISYDTYLQNAIRWAQRYMAHGDYGRSLELMQGLVTSIEEAPSDWWDSRIAATAAQSIPLISQVAPLCGRAEDAGTLIRRIELVCNNNFSGPNLPSREPKRPIEDAAGHAESTADADTHRGKISRVLWERRFGFIQMTDGTDLFFHFTQVKNRDYLALDAEVEFSISKGVDGRPVAVGVQCKHAIPHPVNIGQKMTGTIKSIAGTYGFVFGEDGHDYFFHKGNVSGEIQFGSLKKGDLVMFIIEAAARGPVAGQLALID